MSRALSCDKQSLCLCLPQYFFSAQYFLGQAGISLCYAFRLAVDSRQLVLSVSRRHQGIQQNSSLYPRYSAKKSGQQLGRAWERGKLCLKRTTVISKSNFLPLPRHRHVLFTESSYRFFYSTESIVLTRSSKRCPAARAACLERP